VPELTIRPTAKFIKAGAVLAALVVVGLEILYLTQWTGSAPYWVMVIPLLILVWPASRWMRRRCTKTVISADRLRYEVGLASRSTRNIQLSKIQDVRVDQSLTHRLFGVGNLSIETAGEASRLTLRNVDSPQRLADEIMSRAQKGTATV
jgi:putative membrane protein